MAEYPIEQDLVRAFRKAAGEFSDWQKFDGPEPQIPYRGGATSIMVIANLASNFEDQMPDDIFDLLKNAGRFGDAPLEKTFAAGGQFLYRLYSQEVTRRAKQNYE